MQSFPRWHKAHWMKQRTKKRILCFLLLVLMIGLVLCGGRLLRNRGNDSVKISPSMEAAPMHVAFFRQKDAAWKDDALGESSYTMGDSGCLTTCLASAFVMQGILPESFSDELTPGTLNAYFSANEVYDKEGNLQWEVLSQSADVNVVMKDADDLADGELEQLLSDEIYPIVKVRVDGVGSYHFVLLVGSENSEFLCMDPLQEADALVPLSESGGKIYTVRYVTAK